MAWHPVADVADLAGTGVIGREIGACRVAVCRINVRYFATSGLCLRVGVSGHAEQPSAAVVTSAA